MHALRKVRPWIRPDGYVLVIHDLVDPPRIEVHNQQHYFYAGQLLNNNSFENLLQADQAVDTVIQEGIYSTKQSKIFENYIRADSLPSMLEYLADSWENAYMTDGTRNKLDELVETLGEDSEVVLHMISRMVRLDVD